MNYDIYIYHIAKVMSAVLLAHCLGIPAVIV